ncbi:hypothetical protein Hanom_Chr02g00170631 [Helianthus anomalus]
MGTLSRSGRYCPIYKPWNKLKVAKKQALLALLELLKAGYCNYLGRR